MIASFLSFVYRRRNPHLKTNQINIDLIIKILSAIFALFPALKSNLHHLKSDLENKKHSVLQIN